MFADKYLNKQNKKKLISVPPEAETGMTVVIPCYNEPEIAKTLDSLVSCTLPQCLVEVLVVVNHSENSPQHIKANNTVTKQKLDQWILKNPKIGIRFFVVGPLELRKKWAGAGLARKQGMDEAILRYNANNKQNGLIISLDADTLVDKNYFKEIEKHFKKYPRNVGATIAFEHQKLQLETKHLEGIELYENYLAYYKRALDYTGYPYSMFTIGSAFVVTALAYVKRGGMNRRQAGEDFYFLQGLTQIGKIGSILNTKVYPSARLSDRVPFGTGPMLSKWMKGEEDLNKTYSFRAFEDLKAFFEQKDRLYKSTEISYQSFLETLPGSVSVFLKEDKFWEEVNDLNTNCSTLKTFQNRFFQKFNAFKVLKYLNFAHENFYGKAALTQQISLLQKELNGH